jgi:pimeloyl-ACP methyl ester carboxylesterase
MASCTYTVPDKNASGDNFYGAVICNQAYVDYFWNTYGFSGNKVYWDDGWGWDDCCNTNKPLARAFNGCYALTYSAQDYLNDSYSSAILNWGRRYVRENIDDLRSFCGDGSAIARAKGGGLVEVYLGFFYTKDVPGRAETLIHEARHQGGKPHNDNFPAGSTFGAGSPGRTRPGTTRGRECTAPCTSGGTTQPRPAQRRPCASAPGSAGTWSSTTPSPRIPASRSEPRRSVSRPPGVPYDMATNQTLPLTQVMSADGTLIAFEQMGAGRPLILVGGATCDAARMRPTAEHLARDFAVINYDRRGRGDSSDTLPYAVEHEVEDLAALIARAGGTASVYGHSSGAGLALHAAAQGLPIDRLILHEPPYSPDIEEHRREAREYGEQLESILSEGRRGDAIELFFTVVGMPAEMVAEMRRSDPGWPALEALAPTLAYDSAVMGDMSRGGTVPPDLAGRVAAPTLVLVGGASPEWMIDVGRELADTVQNSEHRVLDGQEHVVPPEILAPVVKEFLAAR